MFTGWPGLVFVVLPIATIAGVGLCGASTMTPEGWNQFLVFFVILPLVSATFEGLRIYAKGRDWRWRGLPAIMAALTIAPTLGLMCLFVVFWAFVLIAAMIVEIEIRL